MKIIILFLYGFFLSEMLFCSDMQALHKQLKQKKSQAVVFMYHRFGNSKYPSTNITMEQFKAHLEYIEKNNFQVWKLSKIVRYLKEHKTIPSKTVAISVDDAYKSTYTNAYPLLKERGYPFTVFINTHPIDVRSKSYMSWDEMREMAQNGVEFANHSLTHEYLLPNASETKQQWEKRLRNEVQEAQKRLQEELGERTNTEPKMFSYPFGEYNEAMAEILKSLGYVGIAQESGVMSSYSNMQALPRYPMSERFGSIKGFTLKINTHALPVRRMSPIEPVLDKNNPPKLRISLVEHIGRVGCFLSSGEKIDFRWIDKNTLEVQAQDALKGPRDRYTCTAPADGGGWYWYSHMWIIPSKRRGHYAK